MVNNGNGTVTYAPFTPYVRSDSFTYTVSDGLGDTATAAVNVSDTGLDAYYKCDEGAGTTSADSTGDGFTATLNGATWTTGISGDALSFNGASSYATIPALMLDSNTMTIAGWINRNGSQNAWTGLVYSRAGSTISGFHLGTANELRYTWNGVGSTYSWNSGLTVPNGQWTFVALVITGSNATIYMQPQGGAMQSATNAVTNAPSAFDGVTDIGQDPVGGRFFNGSMDEVHIYNTALSGAALTALLNDVPPTVATAAAASSNPVNGPRTNLSVLGASGNGESTLNYTWAATALPNGASAPIFSANGTNAAKNTVVTFTSPGAYTIAATIADAYGLSVVSSVNVTVASTQLVWTGSGGNNNWSNVANWTGGWAPQKSDQLAFSGASTNDLSSGTVFTSINLQGSNTALSGNPITLVSGTNIAITSTGTNNLIGAAIQLAPDATIAVTSGTLTISAVISGTSGLIDTGTGTLLLTGANTYSGGTTISGGTLQVGNGGTSGSLGSGNVVDNGNLVYSYSSSHAVFLGSISGSGSVSGTGGSVDFFGSTLNVGGNLSFTQVGASALYTGLQVGYGLSSVSLSGSSISLAGDLGYDQNQGGSLALDTSADNGPINLNISIGRAGIWYPLNSFTANAGLGTITWSGAYAATNNQTTPISLSGAIHVASGCVGAAAQTMTLNATGPSTVSGALSGPLSLVAGGPGTLTLTGSNTYTGGTTVNGGTLAVNGWIGNSTTTVNSGGTLAGTGATGAVTVASGGIIAPGISGTGTLSLSNNSISLSGTAEMAINASTGASSFVQGISTVTYGGTLMVNNLAGALTEGNTFTLFSASSYSGSFASIALPALSAGLVWDTSNLAVNGSIRVDASNQVLTSIAVAPATVNLGSHGTAQFTATGYDQFGVAMITQPTFTWSNSGAGSVNASGLYTGSFASGSATVTASSGSVNGAASATVTDVAPTVATAATASPSTVSGSTTSLSVLGADSDGGGEPNLTYTWSATSIPTGATAPTYSANGTNASKNTTATFTAAGAYTLKATITDAGGMSTSSSVTVTVSQTLTSIGVTPGNPGVPSGGTLQLTGSAYDQFGAALGSEPTFNWAVAFRHRQRLHGQGCIRPRSVPGGTASVTANSRKCERFGYSMQFSPVANGVWINPAGGSWTSSANWQGGGIPSGSGYTADFSTLNLVANATVTLDGSQTIGTAIFGDTASYGWIVNSGSSGALALSATAGVPVITVKNQAATINAVLSGTQGLTVSGSGTLGLSAAETLTGPVTINSGAVVLSGPNASASGLANAGNITINNGAVLSFISDNALTGYGGYAVPITVNAGGTLAEANAASDHVFGLLTLAGGVLTSGSPGGTSVTYGTVDLDGGLTAGGVATTSVVSAVDVALSQSGGTVFTVNPGAANGIDLDVTGAFYHGSGIPDNGLIKKGSGVMRLDGSNSYTSATTVSAGTLSVIGSIAGSAVTVSGSGTLAGTGTTGAVTVTSGGTLTPGVSGAGALSLNNTPLSLSGTAVMAVSGSTGTNTKVLGISTVTYGGALNVTNLSGTLAAGNRFTLFSASTYSGSFATINLPSPGSGLLWNTADLSVNGSIIVTGTLPSGWSSSDIGAVGVPGYSAYSGTTYTVNGSGAGIGSTADAFQFASQTLTGDGDIRAQVTSQTNTGINAMAGVMIRSGSGAGALNALVALTPAKGFIFQSRATVSGTTSVSGTAASYTAPNNWVRLTRSGTLISAYISTSGTAWTEIGTVVTTMTNSVSVGLAVTSGSNTTASVAAFASVTVTPFPSPWQSVDIGSPGLLGSAEYYNSAYTLKGAGNIGGSADNYHFVYQSLSGTSGTLSAQISTLQNTGTSSAVGVMIRTSLTSNSQYAFMGVSGSGSFETLTRASTGGSTTTTTSGSGTLPNLWVKAVLSGTTLSGYNSTNGTSWTLVKSTTISMGSNVYIGFADASGTTTTLNTSVFSNVTYTP